MTANNIPSRNPAQNNDASSAFDVALRKHSMQHDDMLPVRVLRYDRALNRAEVEHVISMVSTSGEQISRGRIASVPALRLGDSNFSISFPIPSGSLGWIKACDRDISLFLQSLQYEPPNDGRIHDFSSGVFIPDSMGSISSVGDGLSIQSNDGKVFISLTGDGVTIESSSSIEIKSQVIDIQGTVNISGTTSVNGSVSVSGALTNNGVNVGSEHKHESGQYFAGSSKVTGISGNPQL